MRETDHGAAIGRLLVTIDQLGSKIYQLVDRTAAPVTMTDNGQCLVITARTIP